MPAVRAFLLLAGFYLLGVVVLGVLVGADVAIFAADVPGSAAVKLYVVSVLLAIPLVQGMLALRTPKDEGGDGLVLTEERQPELWHTVRTLAEQAGTPAPDELVLTGDVNASVTENARLLGLLPGPRRMRIGAPLLVGLNEPQLHAVLGHELGHFSNADTRLSQLTLRGRYTVSRTIQAFHDRADKAAGRELAKQEKRNTKLTAKGKKAKAVDAGIAGFSYRLMAKPFIGYAHFYLRVTLKDGRAQELAADRIAAKIAGRDVTASALRQIPVLDAAYGFYMESYATLGTGAGLLPPPGEVFGGLRHLLAARGEELARLRAGAPREELSPYDSHPPIADRVALLGQLPDDGRGLPPARPAIAVLRDPARVLAELEDAVLTAEARGLERVDWGQLVHRSLRTYVDRGAEPLRTATAEVTGGPGTLDALLWAVDNGQQWAVVDKLPKSAEAASATGRAAREFARPRLRSGLKSLTVLALVDAQQAWWELAWHTEAVLRLPQGYEQRLDKALDAAVSDTPNTGPLRTMLPQSAPAL
ncbi:Protease HtpX [Streptomyces sp. RB5]|uniref:Protease HtpX n=1 Tax=Streptomyces smaragdinus TaxID=2585196 RepID=A0A7K0CMZ5_9ACTN|nr:M48 family metallopeptidase [Streptomyces smaragdinus]MQY14857.1 Protease HtpX [Streptomyces smaragdinus]